ncbi:MAG: hypothetical protein AAF543_24240 [Pseudomonadota bacterium]
MKEAIMTGSFKTLSTSSRYIALLALMSLSVISPVAAADDVISIELNKTDETEQGCRPLFVFDNQSDHQLNAFQIELVLFDQKGVYSRQILLDMAPLYREKKVVASFLISETSCEDIGSMLVNGLPRCANSAGDDLDCLAFLDVSSKSTIPLEK